MVITFAGDQFASEIMSELRAVRGSGVIRLIDLLFVTKSSEGIVESVEVSDLRGHEIEELAAVLSDLIPAESRGEPAADVYVPVARDGVVTGFTDDDVRAVAGAIPNGSAAAIVLFEHTWARSLAQALQRAGAAISREVILDGGRVREPGR
jgi:uncharacterized membrane protein